MVESKKDLRESLAYEFVKYGFNNYYGYKLLLILEVRER